MEGLENELEELTGISTVKALELALEGVLLSQDCGILYEVKHAVGVQYVFSRRLAFMGELIRTVSGCTARLPRICTQLLPLSQSTHIFTQIRASRPSSTSFSWLCSADKLQ